MKFTINLLLILVIIIALSVRAWSQVPEHASMPGTNSPATNIVAAPVTDTGAAVTDAAGPLAPLIKSMEHNGGWQKSVAQWFMWLSGIMVIARVSFKGFGVKMQAALTARIIGDISRPGSDHDIYTQKSLSAPAYRWTVFWIDMLLSIKLPTLDTYLDALASKYPLTPPPAAVATGTVLTPETTRTGWMRVPDGTTLAPGPGGTLVAHPAADPILQTQPQPPIQANPAPMKTIVSIACIAALLLGAAGCKSVTTVQSVTTTNEVGGVLSTNVTLTTNVTSEFDLETTTNTINIALPPLVTLALTSEPQARPYVQVAVTVLDGAIINGTLTPAQLDQLLAIAGVKTLTPQAQAVLNAASALYTAAYSKVVAQKLDATANLLPVLQSIDAALKAGLAMVPGPTTMRGIDKATGTSYALTGSLGTFEVGGDPAGFYLPDAK